VSVLCICWEKGVHEFIASKLPSSHRSLPILETSVFVILCSPTAHRLLCRKVSWQERNVSGEMRLTRRKDLGVLRSTSCRTRYVPIPYDGARERVFLGAEETLYQTALQCRKVSWQERNVSGEMRLTRRKDLGVLRLCVLETDADVSDIKYELPNKVCSYSVRWRSREGVFRS
jgi:hypothetical protein